MSIEDSTYSRLQDLGIILVYLLGVGLCMKFIWRGLDDYFKSKKW